MDSSLFHTEVWAPLANVGITSKLATFNAETIIFTWIALFFLALFGLLGRIVLKYPESIPGHITLTILKSFNTLVEQAVNRPVKKYFFFISAIFIFIFTCNALVLLPWMEEPTKDINTTIALGLISFFYVQKEAIIGNGIVEYLLELFKMPFTLFPEGFTIKAIPLALIKAVANIIVGLLSFPLELLGKLASIVSLALRLFGNIFGSSVISTIFNTMTSGSSIMGLVGKIAGYNFFLAAYVGTMMLAMTAGLSLVIALFFGLFESFIQAFVFSILTMTYISMNVPAHIPETKS